MMTRLFTYTIPVDDGAAPNPFGGICSLAICKPAIRRVAKIGDWVVGLGSKRAPSGDLSGHLVYAMKVEDVISLQEYDRRSLMEFPEKIPDFTKLDQYAKLGDSIYSYHSGEPHQRKSVHTAQNIQTDLSGRNVLLSKHFYYFGNKAIMLPYNLLEICHQHSGHKSDANKAYFNSFVSWIENLEFETGIHGTPDYKIDWDQDQNQLDICNTCITC